MSLKKHLTSCPVVVKLRKNDLFASSRASKYYTTNLNYYMQVLILYFGIWASSPVDVKLAENKLLNSGASKSTTTTTSTTTTPYPLT